jgi:hypothetical protein
MPISALGIGIDSTGKPSGHLKPCREYAIQPRTFLRCFV